MTKEEAKLVQSIIGAIDYTVAAVRALHPNESAALMTARDYLGEAERLLDSVIKITD